MNRAAFDIYIETQLAPTLSRGDGILKINVQLRATQAGTFDALTKAPISCRGSVSALDMLDIQRYIFIESANTIFRAFVVDYPVAGDKAHGRYAGDVCNSYPECRIWLPRRHIFGFSTVVFQLSASIVFAL